MSLRLRLLNLALRGLAQPRMRRQSDPDKAQRMFERAARRLFRPPPYLCHLRETAQPPLHWVRVGAAGQTGDPRRAILFLHGGAFLCGSGHSYAALAGRLSKLTGLAVCLPDYRLLQQSPFPAAPQDALAAWEALLDRGYDPSGIVLMGDSAGGNLALGLLSTLLARGQRPAALVAFSPWSDLTLSGGSLTSHLTSEALLPRSRMEEVRDLYLNGADPALPLASPLLADYPDPPPALIQVGSGEILFDDAARMAKKLNARLSIWDDCPHVWQIFDGWLPEARAALRDVAEFVHTSLNMARR